MYFLRNLAFLLAVLPVPFVSAQSPGAPTLPPTAEADELLTRTRTVTLAAANAMPDFLVKQLIRRSVANGIPTNWISQDSLSIAVGYRANQGEQYKLLSINGVPAGKDVEESRDYSKYAKGATSSRVEYISALADIFKPETNTEFRMVDTDTVQGRRTIVFKYAIKKQQSQLTLTLSDTGASVVVGSKGRIWIDRELNRVLRFEQIATEIPSDFRITAASTVIDYDWVQINERKYLLPLHSEILLTTVQREYLLQYRNDVRFRNYQKYQAELKVVDELGEADETTSTPPPTKPTAEKPAAATPAVPASGLPKPSTDTPVDDTPPLKPKAKPAKPAI